MNTLVKNLVALLPESDGARAQRHFKEEVEAHAERQRKFYEEAEKAGFTPAQIEFMLKFVALSNHSHQYYASMHYLISSPPVDGRFEDRER